MICDWLADCGRDEGIHAVAAAKSVYLELSMTNWHRQKPKQTTITSLDWTGTGCNVTNSGKDAKGNGKTDQLSLFGLLLMQTQTGYAVTTCGKIVCLFVSIVQLVLAA